MGGQVELATPHASPRKLNPTRGTTEVLETTFDTTAVTSRRRCSIRSGLGRSPWVLPLVSLFLYGRAWAQDPPNLQVRDRQVKTLARVLAYDENLTRRAGNSVVLAVIYSPGNPGLKKEASEWFASFSKLESYNIRGLPFHVVMLPFADVEKAEKSIADSKAVALYVCPGLEGETAHIKRISRKRKATTIASREEQVAAGLALGVFSDHGKFFVVVNLPASRAEGAQFDSDLLRLAKVIQ
jgi:hypothetical protein